MTDMDSARAALAELGRALAASPWTASGPADVTVLRWDDADGALVVVDRTAPAPGPRQTVDPADGIAALDARWTALDTTLRKWDTDHPGDSADALFFNEPLLAGLDSRPVLPLPQLGPDRYAWWPAAETWSHAVGCLYGGVQSYAYGEYGQAHRTATTGLNEVRRLSGPPATDNGAPA
ncbi:hypothetical protein [Streptomyces chryseus]|uniref:hypothetical protein n=1 Tax=Streptomyces chryseus TaxID=68186 RepID=UPI00110F762D|nr:hypothetical protein [Streptomyces chryseus]GGX36511.1 hypothetical protein GCM10010353_59500 [Streptomyces chryseus]